MQGFKENGSDGRCNRLTGRFGPCLLPWHVTWRSLTSRQFALTADHGQPSFAIRPGAFTVASTGQIEDTVEGEVADGTSSLITLP